MIPRNRLLFLCLVITSLFLTFRYAYRTDSFSSVEIHNPVSSKPHSPGPLPQSPGSDRPYAAGDAINPPKEEGKGKKQPEAEPQEPIPGEPDEKDVHADHTKEGEVHDDLSKHKPEDKGLGAMKPKPVDGEKEKHPQSGVDHYVKTPAADTAKKPSSVSEEDKANESGGIKGGTTAGTSDLDKDTKWVTTIETKVEKAIEAHKNAGAKDVKAVGERAALLADLYRQQVSAKFTSSVLERSITLLQSALYPWLLHERFSYAEIAKMMTSISQGKGKRGLVIPVSQATGSHGGARLAAHLILTVRKVLKSKIPIEIIYMGNEDLRSDAASRLKSLASDVKLVDIKKSEFFDNSFAGLPNAHAIKSFAILASSFDEVIVADQDVVFLRDPLSAFESEEYVSTGTVFYHTQASMDPSKKGEHNEMVTEMNRVLAGVTWNYKKGSRFFESDYKRMSGSEMDSSVFVVDKRRVWPALLMTANLNAKPIRDDWTYYRLKGDRESYWLAFTLSNTRYNFTSGYAGDMGTAIRPTVNGGIDPSKGVATTDATHTHAFEMGTFLCDLHTWHPLDSKRREAFWMSGSLYKDRTKRNPELFDADRMGYVDTTETDEGFGSGKEPQVCLGGKSREISVLGVEEVNTLKEMVELVKGKVEVKKRRRG